MKSKRIVLFTNKYPFEGGEVFLETEFKYLVDSFDEIIIFTLENDNKTLMHPIPLSVRVVNPNEWNGVRWSLKKTVLKHAITILIWYLTEIIKSPFRLKYFTQLSWNWNRFAGLLMDAVNLNQFLKRHGLDKELCYTYWFNEWTSMLALAKKMDFKGSLLTRAHGYDFDEQQQPRGYHPFRYAEWKGVDRVVQISEYGVNYMKSRFGLDDKIVLSRLGVEDHGVNPVSTNETFHIVSCSGFVELKRLPLIADILSKLSVKYHWTHIGGGEGMDETLNMISRKLPNGVFTFKGSLKNCDIMSFYAETPIDLFINASRLEGLPVSLMEACSFGIPVAGFDICGVPEIVNSCTGILLKNADIVEKHAVAIDELLQKKCRDLHFRKSVRNYWKQNFNSAINYPLFIKYYLN